MGSGPAKLFGATTAAAMATQVPVASWVYEGCSEPTRDPDMTDWPPKTLFVFDFDCTITSVHLYHTLNTEEGREQLEADADTFYTMIFGGEERINWLRNFLNGMKENGAELRIMSFGSESEIRHALEHFGIDGVFSAVHGRSSYRQFGIHGRGAKQDLLSVYAASEDAFDLIVFVEDDQENYPRTIRSKEVGAGQITKNFVEKWDAWHLEGNELPNAAGEVTLVGYPVEAGRDGEGLKIEEMQELELFFLTGSATAGLSQKSSLDYKIAMK